MVLHDRLGAELSALEVSADRIDDALADVDAISQRLNALTVEAPDDSMRQALGDLIMTLGTLRSSLQQLREADPTNRQAASGLARSRLEDFQTSMRSFRAAVWPQTPSG